MLMFLPSLSDCTGVLLVRIMLIRFEYLYLWYIVH